LVVVVAVADYFAYTAIRAASAEREGGVTPGGGTAVDPGGEVPPVLSRDLILLSTGEGGRLEITVDWSDLQVSLNFRARVWVDCEVDGEQFFEGTLNAGQSLSLPAGEEVYIRSGRALQTEILIGGIPVGLAGETDDPRTVVITRIP